MERCRWADPLRGVSPQLNVEAAEVDTAATNTSIVEMVTPPLVTTPAPQQNITRTKSKKNPQESQRCKRVKEQISAIDARMRAGYRDGEYLRDRRRQLVDERSKACH